MLSGPQMIVWPIRRPSGSACLSRDAYFGLFPPHFFYPQVPEKAHAPTLPGNITGTRVRKSIQAGRDIVPGTLRSFA